MPEPDPSRTHQVTETHAWSENVADHGGRVETKVFAAAKNFAHKIIAAGNAVTPWGAAEHPGDMQMHHSGSLWVFDGKTWWLFLNTHGSEYSGQFMIDPAKLELMRLAAVALVSRFPETLDEMDRLGHPDGRRILNTPIVDAQTISDYVDSVWNSQAPIPSRYHTGVLSAKSQCAGEHHYPKAVTDLQHLKWDDFILWHIDPVSKSPVAVAPTAPRGSGVATVKVEFSSPEGADLYAAHMAARAKGDALVLPEDHPIAQAAFANQP